MFVLFPAANHYGTIIWKRMKIKSEKTWLAITDRQKLSIYNIWNRNWKSMIRNLGSFIILTPIIILLTLDYLSPMLNGFDFEILYNH